MIWLVFSLLNAVFEASKDVTLKRSLGDVPTRVAAWSWMAFSLPLGYVALLFNGPIVLESGFWPALFASGTINVVATLLYAKALKASDLAVTLPLLALNPLFLLVTARLIVGETPSAGGLVGVALIGVGTYTLHITERKRGPLAPFRALFREPGPRYMAGVAFLWSIAGSIDKIGVQNSSPLVWAVAVFTFVALLLTPVMLRVPHSTAIIRAHWPRLMFVGIFAGLSVVFQMVAISMTLVVYALAVKRLSILFGMILGALILKETGLRSKLAGAVVMVVGVICISLL